MLKEQRCGVSQLGVQMSKYVGQTNNSARKIFWSSKTLQSTLYYNLDSSLVKKVEGNLIDHHFEYVYTETNPIVWRYKDFFSYSD